MKHSPFTKTLVSKDLQTFSRTFFNLVTGLWTKYHLKYCACKTILSHCLTLNKFRICEFVLNVNLCTTLYILINIIKMCLFFLFMIQSQKLLNRFEMEFCTKKAFKPWSDTGLFPLRYRSPFQNGGRFSVVTACQNCML